MAKRTTHQLIDDLNGDPADETVQFELDGVAYTIDLSAAHAAELRKAFGPFMRSANATRRIGGRSRTWHSIAAERRKANAAIRAWGLGAGYDVGERGRIRQDVVEAFHLAMSGADSGSGLVTDPTGRGVEVP